MPYTMLFTGGMSIGKRYLGMTAAMTQYLLQNENSQVVTRQATKPFVFTTREFRIFIVWLTPWGGRMWAVRLSYQMLPLSVMMSSSSSSS